MSKSHNEAGQDAFIFLSYSHKNETVVAAVMDRLEALGYNCWRDRRIRPITTWSKVIADHIASCGIMVCFVTMDYLASKYCERELHYADKLNKKTLLVFLEDVQLPSELDMFFCANQHIMHTDPSDVDGLVVKICACEELRQCRRPEQPPQVEAEQIPEAAVPEKTGPVKKKKPPRRGISMKIACVCVVLALIAAMAPFLFPKDTIELYEDLTVEASKTALILNGREITEETLEKISRMEELAYLTFRECSFHIADDVDVSLPGTLIGLEIIDCSGIHALGFIEDLTQLNTLKLENSAINNLSVNLKLPASLTEIDLSGNRGLKNLYMLSGCTELKVLDVSDTAIDSVADVPGDKMVWIDISRTKVTELLPISKWPEISTVRGNGLELSGISPLSQLEKLTAIEFSGCGLKNIPETFLALRMTKLDLSDNELTDLNAFEYCTILENVDISGNQIEDISVLHKSAETLKILGLSGNPLDRTDVSGLFLLCEGIEKLALDRMEIGLDLNFLSNLNDLTYFSASDSSIVHINGLSGMKQLNYLDLSGTKTVHLDNLNYSLKDQTAMVMNLNNTNAGDYQLIPGAYYRTLSICCPEISVIDLPSSISGDMLLVSANVNLESLKPISDAFMMIYIVDCPYDQRVEIEDSIGISKVKFITNDEVDGILAEWNIPRALNE